MQASNRIIVNTLAQYIRTILNMFLSLYSARLVLDALGVSDYGIYSLVAGVVSMLSFFTNSLVTSTQRFLSVAQGRKHLDELQKIFSNSLLIHIVLGFIAFIILEAIAPLLFNGFLNIPEGRENATILIYQQVTLMVYISFIAAPYRALLVSHENIIFTSIVDVMDGVLKVMLVSLLTILPFDKLETYGWIMLSISAFNLSAFAVYDHIKYVECIFPKIKLFSVDYAKNLLGFTGWVTYSSACIALRGQGLAIVLNKTFDTIVNAAYGIGGQIAGMVSFIASSFSNAISPQLMASEGSKDRVKMWQLSRMGSKMPFLLFVCLGIPTMFEMQTLLQLWLGEVPANTMLFGCTFLGMQIVDQLTTGLNMANRAIGKIGLFTILTYTPKLLILPCGWLMLHCGSSLWSVCLLMFIIEVLCMLLRIPLLMKEDRFVPREFVADVFLRSIPPVVVSVVICATIYFLFDFRGRFLMTYVISILLFVITAYRFSLNIAEKNKIDSILTSIKRKFQNKL